MITNHLDPQPEPDWYGPIFDDAPTGPLPLAAPPVLGEWSEPDPGAEASGGAPTRTGY